MHDLHPRARSRSACARRSTRCGPYLESHGGDVELLGLDDGVVRLRLEGSCSGCPSSTVTLKLAIEDAIHRLAPDVAEIRAEDEATAPADGSGLLQIELSPALSGRGAATRWTAVDGLDALATGASTLREVAGEPVLFVRASRALYAYRPWCAACGAHLGDAALSGGHLACPGCGSRYDVRIAGRCAEDPQLSLEPVPLLARRGRCGAGRRRSRRSAGVSIAAPGSRLRGVARAAAAGQAAAAERCELCGAAIAPEHRHVLELDTRELRCACRACSLLFDRDAAGGGHLRLVPDRRLRLDGFVLTDELWDALRIPVDMAFFFASSRERRPMAYYPSPMGPTESLLTLDAWTDLRAANPVLATLAPDVEALLVNRARGAREHFLVGDRRVLPPRRR